jgi:hypothetical protein
MVIDLKRTLVIRSGKLIPTIRVCACVAIDQRFVGLMFGRNRGRRSEDTRRLDS